MVTRKLAVLLIWIGLSVVGCQRASDSQVLLWKSRLGEIETQIDQLHSKYQELAKRSETIAARSYNAGSVAEGRLTTESGVPVSTSDRSAQSTLYYTPFNGSRISLYDGTRWKLYEFTEISLALSGLTSGVNYDVFLYSNTGTLTLELTAWSSDTARATAITRTDGVYLRSGSTTRRYLGTIRTTSTTTTEDSRTKRFVWNAYNTVTRSLYVTDSTDSWTYATNSWRSTNGSTSNRVEFVNGESHVNVSARTMLLAQSSSGASNYISSGVGLDSTTVNSAQMRGAGTLNGVVNQTWGFYAGYPGLGYHYLQWIENSNTTSITLYGDNGDNTKYISGLIGEIRG